MRAPKLKVAATLLAVAAVAAAAPAARAYSVCAPDPTPNSGGEWRQVGFSLGQSRTQPLGTVLNRLSAPLLAPAWTFDANLASGKALNEITGYPIVADGCVFVGSSRGTGQPGFVFAIDADGGQLVWKYPIPDGGVYSTLAAGDGIVYAFVSRIGSPYVLALDSRDGHRVWQQTVDEQPGADAVSSPVLYDGMVWVGVSGTAAEADDQNRFLFRGSSVLLDAGDGHVVHQAFSIPDSEFQGGDGNAGAAIWSTMSVDAGDKTGYVGTGNPFTYEHESVFSNAVLQIDLDRNSPTFGDITGVYKGDVEKYFGPAADNHECDQAAAIFAGGFECANLDLDFGAAPNIFKDRLGGKVVGAGQKSGVYHAFDPKTCDGYLGTVCLMHGLWKQIMGVPSAVGGIVGTAAYDGTALYVPHTVGGYIAALDTSGVPRWAAPVADAVHWGPPVTVANGVVYTPDLKGFLDAYDAGTGAPLLHRPMGLGAATSLDPTFSWGGATVARNTVYVSIGVGLTSAGSQFPSMPDGFVIAFRPAKVGI